MRQQERRLGMGIGWWPEIAAGIDQLPGIDWDSRELLRRARTALGRGRR